MRKILLITASPVAHIHTPRLISMLADAGYDIYAAQMDGQFREDFLADITGHPVADLEKECISDTYDALLMAPYDEHILLPRKVQDALSNSGLPKVIAPVSDPFFCMEYPNARIVQPINDAPVDFGRLGKFAAATPEQCFEATEAAFTKQDFKGKTILLTAGPTIEDVDPARFVSNRSTGRMGAAIAKMAVRRGARVIVIHGPMVAELPKTSQILDVPIRSAMDMYQNTKCHISGCNAAILCAAVADFAPMEYAEDKIKKGKSETFTLLMKRTPDILAFAGQLKNKPFLVGFAAESSNVRDNAVDKLTRKNCDLLCANDITAPGCGFAVNTNRLLVFGKNDFQTEIPLASKDTVANKLLDLIADKI